MARARLLATVLWLHGASNGELTSARWLVDRLLRDDPALTMVITCNSASARVMVRDWGLARVQSVMAPFDTRGAVRRFLSRWQPQALIVIENELWPERIVQAAAQMPIALLGARISAKTARGWQRVAPGLMKRMLDALTLVSAQDAGSEARFLTLGLQAQRLGARMMLKSRIETMLAPAPFHALCRETAACWQHQPMKGKMRLFWTGLLRRGWPGQLIF